MGKGGAFDSAASDEKKVHTAQYVRSSVWAGYRLRACVDSLDCFHHGPTQNFRYVVLFHCGGIQASSLSGHFVGFQLSS